MNIFEDETEIPLKQRVADLRSNFTERNKRKPTLLFVSNAQFARLYKLAKDRVPVKLYDMAIHVVPTLNDQGMHCA